jgi:hypothetical protein
LIIVILISGKKVRETLKVAQVKEKFRNLIVQESEKAQRAALRNLLKMYLMQLEIARHLNHQEVALVQTRAKATGVRDHIVRQDHRIVQVHRVVKGQEEPDK